MSLSDAARAYLDKENKREGEIITPLFSVAEELPWLREAIDYVIEPLNPLNFEVGNLFDSEKKLNTQLNGVIIRLNIACKHLNSVNCGIAGTLAKVHRGDVPENHSMHREQDYERLFAMRERIQARFDDAVNTLREDIIFPLHNAIQQKRECSHIAPVPMVNEISGVSSQELKKGK